jgi:uncharacterized protein YjdB
MKNRIIALLMMVSCVMLMASCIQTPAKTTDGIIVPTWDEPTYAVDDVVVFSDEIRLTYSDDTFKTLDYGDIRFSGDGIIHDEEADHYLLDTRSPGTFTFLIRYRTYEIELSYHVEEQLFPLLGIEDGGITRHDVEITLDIGSKEVSSVMIRQDGEDYLSHPFSETYTFVDEGHYEIVVTLTDDVHYDLLFTIDRTAPVILGVTDSETYYDGVDVSVFEQNGTETFLLVRDGVTTELDPLLTHIISEPGSYAVIATDMAGNETETTFVIEERVLTSVTQSSLDDIMLYVGGSLDLNGLDWVLTYNDGTVVPVDPTLLVFAGDDVIFDGTGQLSLMPETAGTFQMTVTYEDTQNTIGYTVLETMIVTQFTWNDHIIRYLDEILDEMVAQEPDNHVIEGHDPIIELMTGHDISLHAESTDGKDMLWFLSDDFGDTLCEEDCPADITEGLFQATADGHYFVYAIKADMIDQTDPLEGTRDGTLLYETDWVMFEIIVYTPLADYGFGVEDLTLEVTATHQLAITFSPETASNKTLYFSSDDPSVASVTPDGLIQAHLPGTTVIRAISDDGAIERHVGITVSGIGVTGVSLFEPPQTLYLGDTYDLQTIMTPMDATVSDVTWSSSDPDVIAVDAMGTLQALDLGTSLITVTTVDGGFQASVTIEVIAHPIVLDYILIMEDKAPLATRVPVGGSRTHTIWYEPANHQSTTEIEWTSSDDDIATVDSDGTVTFHAKGTVTITATSLYNESFDTITYTVYQPVTSVGINEDDVSVRVGETVDLTGFILPEDATNDRALSWGSDDPDVATVQSSFGGTATIYGVSEGTAIIWFEVFSYGEETRGEVTLTVTPLNPFVTYGSNGIYGYVGQTGIDLVIPGEIDGILVTSIESNAFQNKTFTSVSLPQTLRQIGSYAFRNSGLTSMEIPMTGQAPASFELASDALKGNPITRLVFHQRTAVRRLDYSTLGDHTSSFKAEFSPNSNSYTASPGTYTYDGTDWTYEPFEPLQSGSFLFHYVDDGKITDVPTENSHVMITGHAGDVNGALVIPETINGYPIERIGYEAFRNRHVTSLTLPEGLRIIEGHAFNQNGIDTKMEIVSLPLSLEMIGTYAFWGNRITSLHLKENMTYVGGHAFDRNDIDTITIDPDGLVINNTSSLGDLARNTFIPNSYGTELFVTKYAYQDTILGSMWCHKVLVTGTFTYDGSAWNTVN